MQRHLRFLFKNREILRLKVNAQEDLLLNGSRAPTHRGACLHLLGKVDLSATQSALTRLADAKSKAALLQGIVRFSSDPGILLLYLETLQDAASRAEAAAAFGAAIKRIDFASISPARMRRVLDLIAATFSGHERVQVLFGLLQSDSFREAFDSQADALPPELAGTFVPLRAAHDVIQLGLPNRHGPDALRDGVRALLDAPEQALRSYPEDVRERLLESAMRWVDDAELEDRATDALLQTLPLDSRSFSRMAMLRAAELLRRHEDDSARALLEQVRANHAGFHMPGKWIEAIDSERIGRLALRDAGSRKRRPEERFRLAFWLDAQRSVWIRAGDPAQSDSFVRDALLQRQVAGAGVAPVLECGVAPDGTPYAVLPLMGKPLDGVLERRSLSDEQATRLALAGCQVLLGLALGGIELPDASPSRFLGQDAEHPLLWAGDLSGARRVTPDAALAAHRSLASAWCGDMSAARRDAQLPFAALDDGTAPSIPDLVRSLAARA